VRVARCPQFSDSRFFRCVAVLVDFLSGRLHAATVWLHRKVVNRKVSASACELTLDTHRCGALIVLDRWSTLVGALGVGGGEKGYQNGGEVVPCQGGRSE